MDTTLLNSIRTSYGFSRSVAYLISVALIALVVERTIYYVLLDNDVIEKENVVEKINRIAPHKARLLGLPETKTQQQRQKEKSNDTKLSEAVVSVQDTLDILAFNLINKGDANKAQDKLEQLYSDLQKYDKKAITDFAKTEAHIEKHQLADVIKQRHIDMVENYQNEMKTLLGNLKTIQSTDNTDSKLEAVLAARKQLENKQLKRSQQPFDPKNLPFKSMKPDKNNKPKTTLDEFSKAGLYNTPYKQYAALGDFTYDKLAGASNPEYLEESDEVVITDAIKAKALELDYDPVKIYHWVLNNVEWIPTWGSMQDADITLGSFKGNAFDISSLHIALLRASKIPARYVHGTIEIPEDKFRNWIGGFNSIEAAGDFASSGGIPTTAIINGGKINTIRMEHIWVEAAIDYAPSRGAVNNDADSWVQMDPSFKQFEYKAAVNISSMSTLDGDQISQSLKDNMLINESEGWVSGLDISILKDAQSQITSDIENNLTTSSNEEMVYDVVGGNKTLIKVYPVLPSSLKNRIVVKGARYTKIPFNLQNKIQISLGKDILGQPINSLVLPWVKVNNHKVTLSFKPATLDDEDVLYSYTNVTDFNKLPDSVSAYLMNVLPVLKLNGTIISQGQSMSLGKELDLLITINRPNRNPLSTSSKIVSGSYLTLTTFGGGVSSQKVTMLNNKITNTRDKLNSGDQSQFDSISNEEFMGDMFYSGSLSYFSQFLMFRKVLSEQYGIVDGLLPSTGTYGYTPKVNYFFGFPQSITSGAAEMDLGLITSFAQAKDADNNKVLNYMFNIGTIASALEHSIPEQMFSSLTTITEGFSAVKLLGLANSLGQKTYRISQYNITTAISNLNLSSDVISEITSAVNMGKVVITHTDNITVNGWTGAGYIILDPEIGDGAYKISGGLNGGGTALGIVEGLYKVKLFLASLAETLMGGTGPSGFDKFLGPIWELVNGIVNIIDIFEKCQSWVAALLISAFLAFVTIGVMLIFSAGGLAAAGLAASSPLVLLGLGTILGAGISQGVKNIRNVANCN